MTARVVLVLLLLVACHSTKSADPIPETPSESDVDEGTFLRPRATPARAPAAAESTAAAPTRSGTVRPAPDRPPLISAPTDPGTLVRGSGPEPNPVAEPVTRHRMLPVDDDSLGRRPPAVSLVWDQSELPLNLYEPPSATPMQVEFSLDGGPWLAARFGRVNIPDLGNGLYQVRCVAIPSSGKTWPMKPVEIERTDAGWRRIR